MQQKFLDSLFATFKARDRSSACRGWVGAGFVRLRGCFVKNWGCHFSWGCLFLWVRSESVFCESGVFAFPLVGAVLPVPDKYSTFPVQNFKPVLTWGYMQLYNALYNFQYKI